MGIVYNISESKKKKSTSCCASTLKQNNQRQNEKQLREQLPIIKVKGKKINPPTKAIILFSYPAPQ